MNSVAIVLLSFLYPAFASDTPRFEDYAVPLVQIPGPVNVRFATADQRKFRTMIRDAATRGVTFAGHYSIAEWGCGAACVQMVVVDLQSGAVYDGPLGALPIAFVYLGGGDDENTGIYYQAESKLLKMRGCPNYKECGNYYFEWTGSRFRLLQLVRIKQLLGADPE